MHCHPLISKLKLQNILLDNSKKSRHLQNTYTHRYLFLNYNAYRAHVHYEMKILITWPLVNSFERTLVRLNFFVRYAFSFVQKERNTSSVISFINSLN